MSTSGGVGGRREQSRLLPDCCLEVVSPFGQFSGGITFGPIWGDTHLSKLAIWERPKPPMANLPPGGVPCVLA